MWEIFETFSWEAVIQGENGDRAEAEDWASGHEDRGGGNRQTGLTDRKAVLGVGERRGSRQWTAGRAGVSLDLVAVPVPGALEACP